MTVIIQTFQKDPNDTLDYVIDWSAWLGTDTISSSTFAVPSGLNKNSDSHTDTTATVWISGGYVGQSYTITNQIVTAGARTVERSFQIVGLDL